MTAPASVLAVAALVLLAAAGWLAAGAMAAPAGSRERLIGELRLLQLGSVELALVAGAYLGFAAWQDAGATAAADVTLALAFVATAAVLVTRDPRQALGVLAAAFAAHALVDIAHRPGWLAPGAAPRWYAIGCATFNLVMAALCYLPVLKR